MYFQIAPKLCYIQGSEGVPKTHRDTEWWLEALQTFPEQANRLLMVLWPINYVTTLFWVPAHWLFWGIEGVYELSRPPRRRLPGVKPALRFLTRTYEPLQSVSLFASLSLVLFASVVQANQLFLCWSKFSVHWWISTMSITSQILLRLPPNQICCVRNNFPQKIVKFYKS